MIFVGVVAWLLCGWIGYGGCFGYFRSVWPSSPWREDIGLAMLMFIGGPIGLLVSALMSGGFAYGFRWRPTTRERKEWRRHLNRIRARQ